MKKALVYMLGILMMTAIAYAAPSWDPAGLPVVAMSEDNVNNTVDLQNYVNSGCEIACSFSVVGTAGSAIQSATITGGSTLNVIPTAEGHGAGTVTVRLSDDFEGGTADTAATVHVRSVPDLGTDIQVDTGYFDGAATTNLGAAPDDVAAYDIDEPDYAYQNSVYLFSLERELIGKVTFDGYFPFIWDLLFASSNVIIENGFISMDSNSLLNRVSYWINHPPATVTLYNVNPAGYNTYPNGTPIVYTDLAFHTASEPRDAWPECTVCSPSWNPGTGDLTFTVNQFSSYGLNENGGGEEESGIPEFSTVGIILAVIVAISGMAVVVKRGK